MKRGDIYFADLDPAMGSETKKKRPVLIVSNDANNRVAATVTIVPITSKVTKVYPFEALLDISQTGLRKQSKAQCHQVRTISILRIQRALLGHADTETMSKIDTALRLHLNV